MRAHSCAGTSQQQQHDVLAVKPWVSVLSEAEKGAIEQSLLKYYGYEFREGQREVVEAVLAGRDVTVFWATGRGKSICYQLPALHTGRIAIVVSPLISLMTDQVERLNNTVGQGRRQVAAFLGSAQLDGTQIARVVPAAPQGTSSQFRKQKWVEDPIPCVCSDVRIQQLGVPAHHPPIELHSALSA